MTAIVQNHNENKPLDAKGLFSKNDVKKRFDELLGSKSQGFITSVLQAVQSNGLLQKADPKTVLADLEAGLVTAETASIVRGYKEGEAEQAQAEKAIRMAAIAQTQGGEVGSARGTEDFQSDEKPTSADEKNDENQRGEGK